MSIATPTPALTDDHIDLLVSAATSWHILASRTTMAFTQGPVEAHVLVATATEAGRLIRDENAAAIRWLSECGRTRLTDRVDPEPYTHRPVGHLDPIEVIKAAQAAQEACSASPTWHGSLAQRLLTAVITCATHRLDGYTDAPWQWTRPQRRAGRPIGIATGPHPDLPDLEWINPVSDLPAVIQHWGTASVVVVAASAAAALPADLPARAGVFLLVLDESHDQVWQSLTALEMQALVLFWPACRDWLVTQLVDPAPEFVEHRSQS